MCEGVGSLARVHPHLISSHPLLQDGVAGAAAQAGGPRLPFPGPD